MIERTVLEIARHRFWAWQRQAALTPRRQLREADLLLGLVEECRLRRFSIIPAQLWRHIVQLLGQVDSRCAEKLGIDRSLDHTSAVLFEAQGLLMDQSVERQRPGSANIIPLFRPAAPAPSPIAQGPRQRRTARRVH